ncbi:hypothetical protein Tco_1218065 [Tanacetum coccineum]
MPSRRNTSNSGTNHGNQSSYKSYKTFSSCGAKKFFGTEGAFGLLTWFESMESVLPISKYLKKLLMEEYEMDDVVHKLEEEFWNHAMIGADVDKYTA